MISSVLIKNPLKTIDSIKRRWIAMAALIGKTPVA